MGDHMANAGEVAYCKVTHIIELPGASTSTMGMMAMGNKTMMGHTGMMASPGIGIPTSMKVGNKGKGKSMGTGVGMGIPTGMNKGMMGGKAVMGQGVQHHMKGGAGGGLSAELRYASPMHAQMAVNMLNGAVFNGTKIRLAMDPMSPDGTKLIVSGLPPGTGWQDVKDYCVCVGPVAFC